MRKRSGAVVCPGCGRLVDVNERSCPYCGQTFPGMFGYGPTLQRWLGGFDLSTWLVGGCIALYVVSLLLDVRAIFHMRGLFDILSPSGGALLWLGMTGGFALRDGEWWTLLTAVFLHGSLLHLVFNMAVTRQYLPSVIDLYGTAQAWIIFVFAGVTGYLLSNLTVGVPTIGASGAIFGLLAAMIVYWRRTHQHAVTQQLWMSAVVMFVFGFLMPNVNNWAHAGGFAGGWIAAELLSVVGRRGKPFMLALAWGSLLVVVGAFGLQIAVALGYLLLRR